MRPIHSELAFNLTTVKGGFISLPDIFSIVRVVTILTVALLIIEYISVAPNAHGNFFFDKDAIHPLLVP